jgi:hypothetical protein
MLMFYFYPPLLLALMFVNLNRNGGGCGAEGVGACVGSL